MIKTSFLTLSALLLMPLAGIHAKIPDHNLFARVQRRPCPIQKLFQFFQARQPRLLLFTMNSGFINESKKVGCIITHAHFSVVACHCFSGD